MSVEADVLFHPINKSKEQTWEGFSWPAFLFGPIWLLIKGLWGHAVIYLLLVIATVGYGALILWFVYGFMGNGLHKALLLKKGYLTGAQADSPVRVAVASTATAVSDPIQRLRDLADLRDRGVLSEAEFQTQKAKLIG